jgi:hypothetical protein
MSNVICHPASSIRVDLAIDSIFSSIRHAQLEQRIARLSESDWSDLIADAVVSELRAPSSGFDVVLRMLRRAVSERN